MKTNKNSENKLQGVKNKSGLLCIADISGFTTFVRKEELSLGLKFTKAFLQAIIESNHLNLHISEIEGDAVFFYRFGTPPTAEEILLQFEKMLSVFHKKLRRINKGRELPHDLSLKLIVHYGEMSQYRLKGFTKLYGQCVIEVHRLLKSSVEHKQYALLTDDYLKSTAATLTTENRQCKMVEELRKLCYTYFPYENGLNSSK